MRSGIAQGRTAGGVSARSADTMARREDSLAPAAERTDPRDRARALVPLIRECADEADRERRLPARVATAMATAGLYKVAAPRSIGGGECDPRSQIETIEIVSAADGAAGWNLMIGIENMGFLGAALPLETARKLYADEGLIVSGALNPLGRASPVPGGYRVTGQWPFGSGCHNAGWFWGQCVVTDGNDVKAAGGAAVLREVLIPSSEFEILDTWHVSGLRGSGSHDVAVHDVFVPDERVTAVMQGGMQLRETGPLYRYPPFSRLAYNKIGVATGIAQAAIEHFKTLASEKQPRGSRKLLREKTSVHLAYAEAVATLRAARAYAFESVEEVWRVVEAGHQPSVEQRMHVHLACSHACLAAVHSVELLYSAAGTTANFTRCPLDRCLRDVRVVPQHIMVSPQWKETAGRVLLGLPGDSPFFND
jgi:alkylation response protein AidB-like acyl-CoA dehydrogenase